VSKSRGRILIIRGGDLADFIMTCPVFTALRDQFPETSIEALGYPRILELGKVAGLLDEFRSIETRAAAGFFARNATLDESLSDYFSEFSIIFSYLYDPDQIFETNVRRISQAQFISGPARPREGENIHATDAFLKPLEKLAIFGASVEPQINLPRDPSAPAGAWLAVNPGRENPAKNWPEAKWRSLLMALADKTSYRILLLESDADSRMVNRLAAALPPERFEVARNLTFPELASRLSTAQAFIGPDSGALQLAAATGIPCIAIWGTTNPAIWKPPGKNVTLLRHRAGIHAITIEEVVAALPMVWTGAE
jgi:heptosyltransferase-3